MNSKNLYAILLLTFLSLLAYGQSTIGAGGGVMLISLEKNQNIRNEIVVNEGRSYIPSLNCLVETELNSIVSGILKINYSKLKAELLSPSVFEIGGVPLEFTQISAIQMINLRLWKRDKKQYSVHRINFGLGGGLNHFFNLIPENNFFASQFEFEDTDSWEFSLNYELSIDIKNFRIGIHHSVGKLNAWREGLIDRSRFSTITGSYILEL